MDAAPAIDTTADVFAEIVCSDPEWVDAEFEQIISGFWDATVSTGSVTPPPTAESWTEGSESREPVARGWSSRVDATVRSPP